jgi:acyl carrier protein
VRDVETTGSAETAERSQEPVQAATRHEAAPVPALAFDLARLNADEREQKVAQYVRQTICRVFGLQVSAEELGDRDRLSDLGMDSLIALELRGELARGLGLEGRIPSTIGFDTGTIGELTRALAALMQPASGESVTAAASLVQVPVAVTAETLRGMSDEQVEQLLMERMRKR